MPLWVVSFYPLICLQYEDCVTLLGFSNFFTSSYSPPALLHQFRSPPNRLMSCLSENDDNDDIKLDPNYHNVEFMITTGPGPRPDLDGRNIVFGFVLEVLCHGN